MSMKIVVATRERLLDAAEKLFAEKGVVATSLRDITKEASANLASVNYHFKSKSDLTKAVIIRRIEPLNRERLELFDQIEKKAKGRRVEVEDVLRAFLTPPFKMWKKNPHLMKIGGRVFSEPDDDLRMFFVSQFRTVIMKMKSILSTSLPDLPESEIFWCVNFVVGAMIHTLTNCGDFERLSAGACKVTDENEIVEKLVTFGAAGFRAIQQKEKK